MKRTRITFVKEISALDGSARACHRDGMRWEQLFADLDSRFADWADAELMAELPDRERQAAGSVTMVQRCAGAIGRSITVRTRGGRAHTGELREVGPDWLLLASAAEGETIVASAAVVTLDGLTSATGMPLTVVASRFDLRLALRGIARDRAPVTIGVMGARGDQGGTADLSGTLDRVGSDFLEVALHPAWEPRRASSVRSVVLLPLAAVDSVRSVPAA